ncbi:hypothetical protein GCM10009613_60770 [Pseudonocardia kongjuensis]|uniref:Uncharacterized protein n=1 Tax=Pseudonocardia kongjuensis TaxID=102227 RepID=A0ABP4J1R7_9PSEU
MSESTPDPTGEVAAPPLDAAARARLEAEEQKRADDDLAGELMVTLTQWRGGALMVEVAKKLRELVKAVRLHRKAGTITLKITVRPISKNTVSTLELVDDVTVKAPTAARESWTLFSSRSGALTLEHPDQLSIQIHNTPAGGQQ